MLKDQDDRWPLSGAQSGIWYAQQLDPDNPIYNTGEYIEIQGPIDHERFETALRMVVMQTESLHVRFGEDRNGPWQILAPSADWQLHVIDVSAEQNPRESAEAWMKVDLARVVDLRQDPLFIEALFKTAPDRYLWYQRIHHIVMDGFGFSLIAQQVAKNYTALVNGLPIDEATFGSLYSILQEDLDYCESEKFKLDKQFWLDCFADEPVAVSLADRAPRSSRSFLRHSAHLSPSSVYSLHLAARHTMASWPDVVIAATAIYLHRMTGSEEVILGLPMMGRLGSVSLRIPGMVMNLLPLRLTVRPDMSLFELVHQVMRRIREVRSHQGYRHEQLRRELKLLGENQRLFGPIVNIMPFDYGLRFAGYRGKTYNLSAGPVDDLSINVYDRSDGEGLHIDFDGNPAVYSNDNLERYQRRFLRCLEQVATADHHELIGRLDILLPEEYEQVVVEWNNTDQELPQNRVATLFETQVAISPEAVALVFEGTTLTYAEVNERANRLAHLLIAQAIGPDQIVAMALPRSIEMVVGLLAVLKTGAAYLPLDPDYPTERIAYMLGDAGPTCIISNTQVAAKLGESGSTVSVIMLDDYSTIQRLGQFPVTNPKDVDCIQLCSPLNPAYVIYTSGSTGKPKGVIVSNEGLTNFLYAMQEQLQLNENDRLLAVTTVAFDISALEIYLPLIRGASIIIAQKTSIQDPPTLLQMIEETGTTIMQATPTLWHALVSTDPGKLKGLKVLVGGEALPSDLKLALQELNCEVTNLYGPTETTIWSTAVTFSREHTGAPTIGKPICNTQIYVLDASLQPVPSGVLGDLYIAGDGLARGYLKRPDLTAERFVANPYGGPGTRMYRTGDLARFLADGSLDYAGRSDHQVKIRGFRIEMGEIEAVLTQHDHVAQVAVVVRDDHSGDQRIVAYIVPTSEVSPKTTELRHHVASSLPDYMVPSAFVLLAALPLTANGKIDRKALPAPDLTFVVTDREPRTPQEEILCDLFAEILGLPHVGIDDGFFDLGGHSLLASRLMVRIREALAVELSIGNLFEAPTVAGLAKQLDHAQQARPAIVPFAERPAEVPLSFAQQRLWFLHCLEGPSPTYNIPLVVRMSGELDRNALQAALYDVVDRHESLRTIFPETLGTSFQQVINSAEAKPELIVVDLAKDECKDALATAVRHSFDLATEPAVRTQLFALGPQEHVLLVLLHHIIGDGWSLTPLVRDIGTAYTARCRGEVTTWSSLKVQYADYALWQHQLLHSEGDSDSLIARQLAFWSETLQDLPEQLELPTDYPRPMAASYLGDTIELHIDTELHRRLLDLARDSKTSLFMVLQSGLAALLTRMGAGTDIPIGSPIAGRNDDTLDDIVGLFVNTLVLRTDTSGDPSFRELLGRVREVNLAAYEHQDVPFERLVEVLNPTRSRARHPLFQIMFAFQNIPDPLLDLPGLQTHLQINTVGAAKFDLTVELREHRAADGTPAGIHGILEYSTDLFKRDTVLTLAERLLRVLEAAVAAPDQAIGRLDILAPEERHKILIEWNETGNVTEQATIPELFEVQVARHPDKVAVVYEGTNWSYAELNNRANRLAHSLIAHGVGPERLVALALPRSLEMVVGLLAVLKAGGTYVPVDPDYPADRIAFMLSDTVPNCIITSTEVISKLPENMDTPQIVLDEPNTVKHLMHLPHANPSDRDRIQPLLPLHPAYIIYTSGSTGKPKGVVIPHQNVVRLLASTDHWFHFNKDDVWTMFHSYAFDFSVWEIWGALLYGGRLILVPHTVSRSPAEFLQLLAKEGVTVLNQTPSAFYTLMQADREHYDLGQTLSLRYIIFGGEALELARLEDWYERHPDNAPTLVNMYGITETTVHVSYNPLEQQSVASSSNSLIGRGIPDLQVYVLDANLQPLPPGVIGEMYVAGAGLARGYLGRPDLTADHFVANPYGSPGTRMYRTGDLARWLEDGTLDYLGRADFQVKIRGFRIELGEIESVLVRHPDVAQVAVIVREDESGDKRLVAYIVPTSGGSPESAELRWYVASSLPDYMVPSAIVVVAELPLTSNGKLDRKALPAPEHSIIVSGRGPRNPREEILCEMFAEILGLQRVGIDDGFFDLGGHSLLAVRLMSRIREALGVELSIGNLFEAPNVAGLAKRLEMDSHGESQGALNVLLPLRANGKQSPLFCVHPAGGLSWCYAGLMKSLGTDYPIYGLQARGIGQSEELPQTLEEMAADYIRHIRSVQPTGPFHLLGWSLGGNVAQAIAVQLQNEGEEIPLLVMLDAYPSHFLPLRGGPDEQEALIALLALGGYDPDSMGDKPLDMKSAVEILRSDGSALASLEESTIINLKETYANSVRILGSFVPTRFHGDLLFFRSTVIPDWFDPIAPETWKPYIDGQIEQYDIDCRHKDLCQPEPLAEIGRVLAIKLQALNSSELRLYGREIIYD